MNLRLQLWMILMVFGLQASPQFYNPEAAPDTVAMIFDFTYWPTDASKEEAYVRVKKAYDKYVLEFNRRKKKAFYLKNYGEDAEYGSYVSFDSVKYASCGSKIAGWPLFIIGCFNLPYPHGFILTYASHRYIAGNRVYAKPRLSSNLQGPEYDPKVVNHYYSGLFIRKKKREKRYVKVIHKTALRYALRHTEEMNAYYRKRRAERVKAEKKK